MGGTGPPRCRCLPGCRSRNGPSPGRSCTSSESRVARSANTGPVETTSACSCNLVRGRSRAPPRRSRDPSCRAGVTLISPEAPRSTSPPRTMTSPPWRQGGPRRDSGLGCATLVLGPVLARSTSTLGARHGDVETSPCRSRTGRLVAAVARHSPTTSAGRGRAPTNRATTQRPRPIGPPFSGLDRALLNGHPAGLSPRRAADRLGTALWDSAREQVALLDGNGVVVSVNRAWRQFGLKHGGQADTGLGNSYLAVCARAADAGEPGAARAADIVRAATAGRDPFA